MVIETILWCFRISGTQFQKHGQVVSSDNAVAVGIDLQSPTKAIAVHGSGINGVRLSLKLRETVHHKRAAVVRRDYFAEINQ